MADHSYSKGCKRQDCGGSCPKCCLAVCETCGLYEGGLTTECPGAPSFDHADAVYAGKEDFVGGRWVAGAVSKHSPEYYRTDKEKK
jgi:hypothetical protein